MRHLRVLRTLGVCCHHVSYSLSDSPTLASTGLKRTFRFEFLLHVIMIKMVSKVRVPAAKTIEVVETSKTAKCTFVRFHVVEQIVEIHEPSVAAELKSVPLPVVVMSVVSLSVSRVECKGIVKVSEEIVIVGL